MFTSGARAHLSSGMHRTRSADQTLKIVAVDVPSARYDANALPTQGEFLSNRGRQRNRTGRLQNKCSVIECRAHRRSYLVIGNREHAVG
jgi:hypothetical protein